MENVFSFSGTINYVISLVLVPYQFASSQMLRLSPLLDQLIRVVDIGVVFLVVDVIYL